MKIFSKKSIPVYDEEYFYSRETIIDTMFYYMTYCERKIEYVDHRLEYDDISNELVKDGFTKVSAQTWEKIGSKVDFEEIARKYFFLAKYLDGKRLEILRRQTARKLQSIKGNINYE